ncbi:hypothetical protein LCGC14_1111940 [marine sediment metagenome]|uniref:LamG domain-containing protein n=1 Tax=marine sediment metagenome TaxID=412755 RepID=A0A0F9QCL3_9ZZZZ
MKKKFILLSLVLMFCINFISGATFDNIAQFDEDVGKYGKYTIRNSILGIPFLQLDKVVELELKENTFICDGFDCYAEKEIILYESGVLISDIRFLYTSKDGREYYHNNPYTLKIENDGKWIDYQIGEETEPGTYYVRLEGKLPNMWTTVDWQIKSNGFWTENWAEWTSGLNLQLLAYYNMTNTTLTLVPDLTENGFDIEILRNGGLVPNERDGIIGTAQGNFTDVNTQLNMTGSPYRFSNRSFSMAFWVNLSGDCGNNGNAHFFFDSERLKLNFRVDVGNCEFLFNIDDLEIIVTDGINLTDNMFHQLGFNINSTGGVALYYDGVLNTTSSSSISGTLMSNISDFETNSIAPGVNYTFDEVGLWNRTLSDAEFLQLYNGGVGITFSPILTEVTLVSPANDSSLLSGQRSFNGTVTVDTALNITNVTLYIWNSTNLINFTTNFTIETTELNVNSYNLSANLLNPDDYTWNYFACSNDTVSDPCGWALENRTFSISQIAEDTLTFEPFVTETSIQTFALNFTTNIDVLSIDSFLNYNGTRTQGSANCAGGLCNLSNIITIPKIELPTENKTFFWELTLFNGTDSININTSKHEQNVSEIIFQECDGGPESVVMNFTAFNETDLFKLSPFDFDGTFDIWVGTGEFKKTINITKTNIDSVVLCISPDDNYFIDGEIEYDQTGASNFTQRNYFFQNDTINNTIIQNISLGLLDGSLSTTFILAAQDGDLLPFPNILIYTERFYPGLDEFRIVQVAKTDDNGRSTGFFKTETVDYRFRIKANGTTLLLTEIQKVVGESVPFTLTFTIGADEGPSWDGFEEVDDLDGTLLWNKTSSLLTFTYVDSSADFGFANLIVEKLRGNESNEGICDLTSTETSAIITCNLTGNVTGLYTARAFISRSGVSSLVAQLTFQIEDFSEVIGDLGLFLGWFLILIASFTFRFNELAGIFMVNVAAFAVNYFGLIAFGPVFLSAMVAISIIIAVVLER